MRERLEYELAVIERTGYALYFLIVADFVRFARERGILACPGLGGRLHLCSTPWASPTSTRCSTT